MKVHEWELEFNISLKKWGKIAKKFEYICEIFDNT